MLEMASGSNATIKKLVSKFKKIIKHYKSNDDIYGLAEVQVGLSKCLDFYVLDEINTQNSDAFNRLITNIVITALDILATGKSTAASPFFTCGMHEDRACVQAQLGDRFITYDDIHHLDWPDLPVKDAVCFKSRPNSITLPEETKLYRILDAENKKYGSWWMISLPKNRREWRLKMAVLTTWNSDDHYVEFVLDNPLNAWQGIAASQKIPETNCILQGGGNQVWVAAKDVICQKISTLCSVPHAF